MNFAGGRRPLPLRTNANLIDTAILTHVVPEGIARGYVTPPDTNTNVKTRGLGLRIDVDNLY